MVGGQPPRIKDACGAASGGRACGPVLDPHRPPAQYGSYAGKAGPARPVHHARKSLSDRKTTGPSRLDTGPLLQGWTGTDGVAVAACCHGDTPGETAKSLVRNPEG